MIPKHFLWIIISAKKDSENARFAETDNIKRFQPKIFYKISQPNKYQIRFSSHWNSSSLFQCFDKIEEKFNTSIICHNLNFVKASNFDLLSSIFKEDFQYRLKLLLKEGLLRKSNVYKKAKNLLVFRPNLSNPLSLIK